jgi:hypothetical protein
MMVHTCNPSTWEDEAGGLIMCSKPAWGTQRSPFSKTKRSGGKEGNEENNNVFKAMQRRGST